MPEYDRPGFVASGLAWDILSMPKGKGITKKKKKKRGKRKEKIIKTHSSLGKLPFMGNSVLQRKGLRHIRLLGPRNIEKLFCPVFIVGIRILELNELILPTNHENHRLGIRVYVGPIYV
jgi:hypothetical protein